jgi:hypothetical protein
MRPSDSAANTGNRPLRTSPCTSAVMKTVFPARDKPVIPSRNVGLTRPSPYSSTERAVRRACSIKSESVKATVIAMWRAGWRQARSAVDTIRLCGRHGSPGSPSLRGTAQSQPRRLHFVARTEQSQIRNAPRRVPRRASRITLPAPSELELRTSMHSRCGLLRVRRECRVGFAAAEKPEGGL